MPDDHVCVHIRGHNSLVSASTETNNNQFNKYKTRCDGHWPIQSGFCVILCGREPIGDRIDSPA